MAADRLARTAEREREEFSRQHSCGPVLTIKVVSSGRLIRYTIPRGLRRKGR